jgi:hypothetical protein
MSATMNNQLKDRALSELGIRLWFWETSNICNLVNCYKIDEPKVKISKIP